MYNLRFGLKRQKRNFPQSEDVNEENDKVKKHKREQDENDGLIEEEEEKEEEENVGTTTDPTQLFPVTRQEFLSAYKIQGLEDVYYMHDWIPSSLAHQWRRELNSLLEWYRPKLKVYGREIQQSRKIAAFSTTKGVELKYSGHQVEMHSPFPILIEKIAAKLSKNDCLGKEVKFNHCMLNMYEDGSVYIGKHSDNVENQVIVTVSLGAERTWIMEEKRKRGTKDSQLPPPKKWKWILGNGSILVMQGNVQRLYTHEIPKEPKVKQPRISITFRQLVNEKN